MAVALAGALGGGGILSSLIGAVISFAISYIINKAFAPEEEERQDPKDQGVKQRIPTDPRNKLPIVYGTKSVSGQITYAEISGDNQRMAFIISLCEGPVSSINSVKWEDKTLSFNGNISTGLRSCNGSTPDEGGSDDFLNGRFSCQVFNGTATGNECPPMVAFSSSNNGSQWGTSNRTMPNTAYAFVELTYDQEKRVTSLSSRLQFNVTGRMVKPLTGDTDAAAYEIATEATSNNPAEIVVDYLTNTQYGAGVPLAAIDFSSFNSHADFCDDPTSYTIPRNPVTTTLTTTATVAGIRVSQITVNNVAGFDSPAGIVFLESGFTFQYDSVSGSRFLASSAIGDQDLGTNAIGNDVIKGETPITRYTSNGVINTNQDVDQNISDLTVGNSGFITWNYGQFGIVSDRIKTADSSAVFSEDNIFGKLQISKLGFDNKLNEITAKFDSAKAKEQEEQIIRSVPASNMNDNEPVLERTVTLPLTDNAIEARRVSAIYLNKSRQDLTVNFTTSIAASGIESGDIVNITHETPGWTNKPFIVHSVEEKVVNNIIGLEITAQEYADSIYLDTINDGDTAPNTRLPNPFASPLIENLVVAEDTSIDEPNLGLSWDQNITSVLVNSTDIGYRDSNIGTTSVGEINYERGATVDTAAIITAAAAVTALNAGASSAAYTVGGTSATLSITNIIADTNATRLTATFNGATFTGPFVTTTAGGTYTTSGAALQNSINTTATLTVLANGTTDFPATGTILIGVTTAVNSNSDLILTNPGLVLIYTAKTSNTFTIDLSIAPLTGNGTTVSTGSTVTLPLTFKSTSAGTKYELSPLISSVEKRVTIGFSGTSEAGTYSITLSSGSLTETIVTTLTAGGNAADEITTQINGLTGSNYSATASGSTLTIIGALIVGDFNVALPTNPTLGLTNSIDTDETVESLISSYHTQVTAISTLGNRSITLFRVIQMGTARVIGLAGADGQAGEDAVITILEWTVGNPNFLNNAGDESDVKASLYIGSTEQVDQILDGSATTPINSYAWYYTPSGSSSKTKITVGTVEAITGTTTNNTRGGTTDASDYNNHTLSVQADGTALGVTTSGSVQFECEIDYTITT